MLSHACCSQSSSFSLRSISPSLAAVGIYQDDGQVEAAREALHQAGYQFALVTPTPSAQVDK